jgi:serine/threonine-protein kinase HipA
MPASRVLAAGYLIPIWMVIGGGYLYYLKTRRPELISGMAPRSLSEADVLLGVRDDLRQGALRFRLSEDGPYLAQDSGVPVLTDLPALLDIAERAESDTAD